jgi:trans-aconitate 2-methyltransferase
VLGIDSSPEMIEAARQHTTTLGLSQVLFEIKNIEEFCCDSDVNMQFDIVYSNAAFHWIADQTMLQRALTNLVRPGGVLAIQMPDTRSQPSHTLMKEAAENCGYGHVVQDVRIPRVEYDPEWYYDMLQPYCQHIDMWSTEFVQQLPTSPDIHPVLQYTSSTGLRPIVAAIREHHSTVGTATTNSDISADDAEALFLTEYTRLLSMHYPKRADCDGTGSVTLFPFRRFFFVATKHK